MKKLYRDNQRVLAGVCSGLGVYFGIDPVLVRLLFIVFLITNFFLYPVIAYIIMACIIPKDNNIIDIGN